jgi:hypothetical protein
MLIISYSQLFVGFPSGIFLSGFPNKYKTYTLAYTYGKDKDVSLHAMKTPGERGLGTRWG